MYFWLVHKLPGAEDNVEEADGSFGSTGDTFENCTRLIILLNRPGVAAFSKNTFLSKKLTDDLCQMLLKKYSEA